MDRSKWEYKKLGEICDKGSSNIAQNKIEDITGEYPLYGASGYVKGIDFYHQEKPYIGVVKDGSGVGRANLYPAKSSLLGTMQYIIPKNGCELGFLLYVIKGLHLEKYKTGAAIPHIYFKDYGKSIVPFPPLADQQRIVAELDCLNEMIALKQEQLKEFDKLAQSVFYDMFGDPIANDKRWPKKKLDELYKVTSSKRILQAEWQDKGVPFYKVADIVKLIEGDDVVPNTFIMESTYNELKGQNVVPLTNDVLITSRGTLGLCYIVSEKDRFYFQDGMITWLSQKSYSILPVYLKSVFETDSFLYSLLHNANMSTVAYLSIGQLSKVEVPLPPLALQQQFAEKIQAIEEQKELVRKSIAETQSLLDYTMDKYFG